MSETLVTVYVPKPVITVEVDLDSALEFAQTLVINSQSTLDISGGELNYWREIQAGLEKQRVEEKRPLLDAQRKHDAEYAPFLSTIKRIIESHQRNAANYVRECERVQHEAEAKAREAERAERERLIANAAERERRLKEDQSRLLEQAEQQRNAGNDAAYERLKAEADITGLIGAQEVQQKLALVEQVEVPVDHAMPELRGITKPRAHRKVVVRDLWALVTAIHENRASLAYITANQEVLDKSANALGDQFQADGCEVEIEYTVSRSRKKVQPL